MQPLILLAATLPGPDAAWDTLLKNPVHVECTEVGDTPYCRSTAVFSAKPDALRETLGNMADHVDKFESILECHKLGDDTMHVVMDFPWPLADRDYVAKYTQTNTDDGGMVLEWTPATHASAPASDERVRLDQFQGTWTLTPKDDGTTEVVYLWYALYGGSLPKGALNTARKKTSPAPRAASATSRR